MWPLMHHKSESRMKPHRKPTNRYYYAVNSQVCSNPHITFNVQIDFRILNHYPFRVMRDRIFPNSLYYARTLNFFPIILSSFIPDSQIRLISLPLIYLSLSSRLALAIVEILLMSYLSWNLLSSTFSLSNSLFSLSLLSNHSLAPSSRQLSLQPIILVNILLNPQPLNLLLPLTVETALLIFNYI